MGSNWRPNWLGVVIGIVVAGGALSVSIGSYSSASRGGGTYVVLWGAVLAGGALAVRSLFRTQGDIAARAREREGNADAELLQRTMSPAAWKETKVQQSALAGRVLSDAEVAERVISDNRAREEAAAARWLANAAAAYASTVKRLKASMTAEEWEANRLEAQESFRRDRKSAARYWLEHSAPYLPPGSRTLPAHLDPATVPIPEDWQVAMYLRPMKLDIDGKRAKKPQQPSG